MSINLETSQNQLRWNKFDVILLKEKLNPYILHIHKRIETGFLSLPSIYNEERLERLGDIWRLHKEE